MSQIKANKLLLEHNISFLLLDHMNVYYSRHVYPWKDIDKVRQKYQVFLFSNELCRRSLELASAELLVLFYFNLCCYVIIPTSSPTDISFVNM
jgi:hypothetical protein